MKKAVTLILTLVAALCLTAISCSTDSKPQLKKFSSAPVLKCGLISTDGFRYIWDDSTPLASSYDLYWAADAIDDPAIIVEMARVQAEETAAMPAKSVRAPLAATSVAQESEGEEPPAPLPTAKVTVIKDAEGDKKITTVDLPDNGFISVLVVAKKKGYEDAYSNILKMTKIDGALKEVIPGTTFTTLPVLTVTPVVNGLECSWTTSIPAADAYDLYYREGHLTDDQIEALTVESIKEEGTKVTVTSRSHTLEPLNSARYYSLVVTATKAGYEDADSNIQVNKMPSPAIRTGISVKRGVAYNFHEIADTPTATVSEMDLLRPGVHWFYDKDLTPIADVETNAKSRQLDYFPMVVDRVTDEVKESLRRYKRDNPLCNYILAYQATGTVADVATYWGELKAIATELHLNIIGPVVGTGDSTAFPDPVAWLDAFFADSRVDLKDVYGIAIKVNLNTPATVKTYIDGFKKFNKKIWVTEVSASEQSISAALWQERYMSEICTYMELDSAIERYAWFTPKATEPVATKPWNQLLNHTNPNTLTDLGIIYVNMGSCEQLDYIPVGRIIKAKDFANCTLTDYVNDTGYPSGTLSGEGSSVHFRPGTDGEPETLDVYNFSANKWLVYNISTEQSGNFNLLLRNRTKASTTVDIILDTTVIKTVSLDSSTWTTTTIDVGSITSGNHPLRLKVTAGNCELGWLKLEAK